MAHLYSPFWDTYSSKKVLASNPVKCKSKELDLGLLTAYQVGVRSCASKGEKEMDFKSTLMYRYIL